MVMISIFNRSKFLVGDHGPVGLPGDGVDHLHTFRDALDQIAAGAADPAEDVLFAQPDPHCGQRQRDLGTCLPDNKFQIPETCLHASQWVVMLELNPARDGGFPAGRS